MTQAHYTDFPGYWGGLLSQRRGAVTRYLGPDLQQNIRLVTDGARSVTDSYFFDAFGKELSASGSTLNPFRYGGLAGY